MWEEELLEPASVQYDDWTGTVAGDGVDMHDVSEFLGINRDEDRVLAIDVSIYGRHQHLTAWGVSGDTGWDALQATTGRGEPIRCRVLAEIEWDPANNYDTNPPPPLSLPVVSTTEFLGHGFKRLQIRLTTRHLPPGARLVGEHLEEGDEGFQYDNED
jgi:hypothetical protein